MITGHKIYSNFVNVEGLSGTGIQEGGDWFRLCATRLPDLQGLLTEMQRSVAFSNSWGVTASPRIRETREVFCGTTNDYSRPKQPALVYKQGVT